MIAALPPGRTVRLSELDLGLKLDTLGGSLRVLHSACEQMNGAPSKFWNRDSNGCQPEKIPSGHRNVVEADECDVPWNLDPPSSGRVARSEGYDVVTAEDCGRTLLPHVEKSLVTRFWSERS